MLLVCPAPSAVIQVGTGTAFTGMCSQQWRMLFKRSFPVMDLHAASLEQGARSVFGVPLAGGGDRASSVPGRGSSLFSMKPTAVCKWPQVVG